jgi:hypothetical protein
MTHRILRLAGLLLVLIASAQLALAQSKIPLIGHFGGVGPNPGNPTTYQVKFDLAYCGSNIPRIFGVLTPSATTATYTADSTGLISSTIWPNDDITCGSTIGGTRYNVTYLVNGSAIGPVTCYQVLSTVGTFNLDAAIPCAVTPPPPPPPPPYVDAEFRNMTLSGDLFANNGTFYGQLNGIFYSHPGDTIASIEAECANACTYVVTMPQTFTLSGDHTLAANVNLDFESFGSWTISGGTLTIPAMVRGTMAKHFSGSFKMGMMQARLPFEWFGAVGDWNGTTGTDNTAFMQACLNALYAGQCVMQAKTYRTTAPLTITRSSIGITGTGTTFAFHSVFPNGVPPGSTIMTTSASADQIDVSGVSGSNAIAFGEFDHFNLARNQAPSGAAAGIAQNYTFSMSLHDLTLEDDIYGFYLHGVGASSSGRLENLSVLFGQRGFTEGAGNYYGFFIDSSDGKASPSLRIRYTDVDASAVTGGAAVVYGLATIGTAINDLMAWNFETASCTYGEWIQQTGPGSAIASSDIHFYGAINDGCVNSCVVIQGTTLTGGAGVEYQGGYNTFAVGTSPVFDILNAVNVRISSVQIGIALNTLASAAIAAQNSSNITLTANQIQGIRNVGILFNGVTQASITANILTGNGSANGLILLQNGTTNVAVNSNTLSTLSGTGLSIFEDNTSHGNRGFETNTIASTLTAPSLLGSTSIQIMTTAPSGTCVAGSYVINTSTTAGTYTSYNCKGTAWVGNGTPY